MAIKLRVVVSEVGVAQNVVVAAPASAKPGQTVALASGAKTVVVAQTAKITKVKTTSPVVGKAVY